MEKQQPQFSRKATAKVLEVSPDSLKDWSRGKPWLLRPSVSAMGKGSRTIYSIFDVYLGAVAVALNLGGMSCKKIAAVLPMIASNPEWFAPETRGILRFHSLETQSPGVEHATSDAHNSESIKFYLLHARTLCTHLNLKGILDLVDERVKQLPAMPHDC
jgi:hypothetical protein